MSMADSTVDHILPRSQGGQTNWQNVVVACHPCNRKKGGRTPTQARMALRKEAAIPEWLPVLTVKFHKRMPSAWLLFLKHLK
jgi:5-methylcytosine-specific restriction endonuclease McrA